MWIRTAQKARISNKAKISAFITEQVLATRAVTGGSHDRQNNATTGFACVAHVAEMQLEHANRDNDYAIKATVHILYYPIAEGFVPPMQAELRVFDNEYKTVCPLGLERHQYDPSEKVLAPIPAREWTARTYTGIFNRESKGLISAAIARAGPPSIFAEFWFMPEAGTSFFEKGLSFGKDSGTRIVQLPWAKLPNEWQKEQP
jgi:hypothetical protein